MARKKGLDREAILDAAQALLDFGGAGALSLTVLAARLEIRSPSLYAHFDGLDGIRTALALRAAEAMRQALEQAAAGVEGDEAVRAVARAYRGFARAHPGLYAAVQTGAPAGSALAQAQLGIVQVVLAALGFDGLERGEGVHAVRVVRSALHGFVDLEQRGGFGLPEEVDESFEILLAALVDIAGARRLVHG